MSNVSGWLAVIPNRVSVGSWKPPIDVMTADKPVAKKPAAKSAAAAESKKAVKKKLTRSS